MIVEEGIVKRRGIGPESVAFSSAVRASTDILCVGWKASDLGWVGRGFMMLSHTNDFSIQSVQ